MDLTTITRVDVARERADLAALGPTVSALGGGSWLFSEPQDHLEGLIDLAGFGWTSLAVTEAGLEIAATCTLAELATLPDPGWPAHPLLRQCCTALFGSEKIWSVATVGGNVCTALPAGPMTSLLAGLDATALVWRADGTDDVVSVADLVIGDRRTTLGAGDVVRSFTIPASSLRSRTAYRKIALSPIGRSGVVLVARLGEDGAFVLTVSGGTVRPEVLRFEGVPTPGELAGRIRAITSWFTDAHGAADWRAGVSEVLAEEMRVELEGARR